MDTAATPDDVRLRKGSSLWERLGRAGAGAVLLLLLVPGLLTWTSGGHPLIAALWAAPLGLFLIGVAAFERNVAWIITQDGLRIGEQRPLGQVQKRMIERNDIAAVSVGKNRFSYPASFSLTFRLTSGDMLISPPLPDITRINETAANVAELLGLPEVAPVDNPLDVDKDEITLGSPVSRGFVRVIRMAIPVLAVLCALPFLIAFAIGESELALEFLLPLGLLAAFALYRYAHRFAGTFWHIRDGEVRIERIALNGKLHVERIGAADVASVDVRKPGPEDRTHRLILQLRGGQTFRSPTSHDASGAHAVRAEIIQRLSRTPDRGMPLS